MLRRCDGRESGGECRFSPLQEAEGLSGPALLKKRVLWFPGMILGGIGPPLKSTSRSKKGLVCCIPPENDLRQAQTRSLEQLGTVQSFIAFLDLDGVFFYQLLLFMRKDVNTLFVMIFPFGIPRQSLTV